MRPSSRGTFDKASVIITDWKIEREKESEREGGRKRGEGEIN